MVTENSAGANDRQFDAAIAKIVARIYEHQRQNPQSMSQAQADSLAQQVPQYLAALRAKDTAKAAVMLQQIAGTSGSARQAANQPALALGFLPGLLTLPFEIGAAGLNFIGGLVATGANVVSAVAQAVPAAVETAGETLVSTIVNHRVPAEVELKIPTLGEYVPTLGIPLPFFGIVIDGK